MTDKCKGPRSKAKKAYEKYRKARDTYRSKQKETDQACHMAEEDCAVENFEGKTGNELKMAIITCRLAHGRCITEDNELEEAETAFDEAYTKAEAAIDDLGKCEHKKKGGKK